MHMMKITMETHSVFNTDFDRVSELESTTVRYCIVKAEALTHIYIVMISYSYDSMLFQIGHMHVVYGRHIYSI